MGAWIPYLVLVVFVGLLAYAKYHKNNANIRLGGNTQKNGGS